MNDIVYQAGDLVEVILDKKSMKFDRYKTSNHIEGLAIVTGCLLYTSDAADE